MLSDVTGHGSPQGNIGNTVLYQMWQSGEDRDRISYATEMGVNGLQTYYIITHPIHLHSFLIPLVPH
jgi:hypothetical protein